ncbi:DUF4192 domain-containing protein [Arthrobacter castelli]|uniref:DUF4192 domain-containing protein n=1 Tax=Arthrobacter castelli TaxID=271431 RepID=UPI000426D486|nr:DUF4192 domain-containing protein [Arthrobacter castelli]
MTIEKPFGVSTAADVLSFIPHSLGYWPGESLVFITLTGKVSGATLRVDLPDEPGPVPLRSFVKQVRQYLTSDTTADGTIVAMYTELDWQASDPPHRPVMTALQEELRDAGIPLRDAWWVGPSTWGCYDCSGNGCCPPSGRDIDDITTSMLNAELIFQGSHYGDSLQDAHANRPEAGSGREVAVDHATAGSLSRIGASWLQQDQFTATLAAWQVAMSSRRQQPNHRISAPGAESTGFLLASLNTKMIRDCLLVQISVGRSTALTGAGFSGALEPAGGYPVVPDGLRRALKIAPMADALGGGDRLAVGDPDAEDKLLAFRDVLLGQHTGVPDWPVINRAAMLFQSLLEYSTGTPAAALLTMLAWIEWIKGRGSSAAKYVDSCLQIDPEYELAILLDELFSAGMLPSWAMSPATAWRGGSKDAA